MRTKEIGELLLKAQTVIEQYKSSKNCIDFDNKAMLVGEFELEELYIIYKIFKLIEDDNRKTI